MLTYIDLSATSIGISPGFSFYLISIANAGSGLGRISSGLLADRFGALTVIAPLTLLCGVMTFIWPFVSTKGGLIAIGIVYGFCSGAYVSLIPVPVVMMGDMHDTGRRTGSVLTCIAFGAVAGPPISGAIAQYTNGFKAVGYYAGTVLQLHHPFRRLADSFSSISTRIVHLRRRCILIPHEIPHGREPAWKMLVLEKGCRTFSNPPPHGNTSWTFTSLGLISFISPTTPSHTQSEHTTTSFDDPTLRRDTIIDHILPSHLDIHLHTVEPLDFVLLFSRRM